MKFGWVGKEAGTCAGSGSTFVSPKEDGTVLKSMQSMESQYKALISRSAPVPLERTAPTAEDVEHAWRKAMDDGVAREEARREGQARQENVGSSGALRGSADNAGVEDGYEAVQNRMTEDLRAQMMERRHRLMTGADQLPLSSN